MGLSAPHPSSSKGGSASTPCLASSSCSQGGFLSPSYVPHHALSATTLPQPAQAEGRAAPDLPDPTWSPLTFRPILSRGQILLTPYLSPGYGTQVVSPPRCSGGYVVMTRVPFAGTSRNPPLPFLDRPSALTGLLDSVMLTHLG